MPSVGIFTAQQSQVTCLSFSICVTSHGFRGSGCCLFTSTRWFPFTSNGVRSIKLVRAQEASLNVPVVMDTAVPAGDWCSGLIDLPTV